ncbi:MAG: polysaccharide biosynthesis protein [Planctomycetes bacterium]|nr:polysaccharide biosynthesis protein [Planctomycetota bacterium]
MAETTPVPAPPAEAPRSAPGRSHLLVVAAALAVFAVSYLLSFLLRFDFTLPPQYPWPFLLALLPFVLGAKLVVFTLAGVFRILWAYVGIRDLFRILHATVIALIVVAAGNYLLLRGTQIPRTVLVLDGMLTFLGVGGLYALLRHSREASVIGRARGLPAEPIFLVGAGNAAEALLREIQRNPDTGVRVAGILDDAPAKKGRVLRGVKVLGAIDRAREFALEQGVRKAYIAIPSAGGSAQRRIVNVLLQAGLSVKILPPVGRLAIASGFLPQLREISVEDLLRRDPVKLDTEAISAFVRGKKVLVTGAAGSIGSELCRQLLEFHPSVLVALDCAETPLHTLLLELRARSGDVKIVPELADVTDRARLRSAFQAHRPEVVFHAAAFKHVPLLEDHPREAVRVNVGGTRVVSEEARDAGARAFVLISSDKAVNPSSVMGTTKRIAEMVVGRLNESGATRYVAVRFGNVLGSNGSVLPIFKEQLARGGPITVTHPEMKRYFMTIPEAVQLVLQAAVLGKGGEVFVLDMGEPVKIVDLAKDLIRLSGLVPDVDVRIEFTGIRPGEKLFEELRLDHEIAEKTPHPQIFLLRGDQRGRLEEAALGELEKLCINGATRSEIVPRLKQIVPDFRPE